MRTIQSTDEWSLVMTNDYKFGYVFKEYTENEESVSNPEMDDLELKSNIKTDGLFSI